MKIILKRNQSGMSLIEVIIASAVVLTLSLILISINITYLRTSRSNLDKIKATYLIEQAIESVNFLAHDNWDGLGTVGTDYYLVWNGANWVATTTKSLIDEAYDLSFVTTAVNRDEYDDIVAVGGTTDIDTRLLTVEIAWVNSSGTTTKSMSTYLMKYNE